MFQRKQLQIKNVQKNLHQSKKDDRKKQPGKNAKKLQRHHMKLSYEKKGYVLKRLAKNNMLQIAKMTSTKTKTLQRN